MSHTSIALPDPGTTVEPAVQSAHERRRRHRRRHVRLVVAVALAVSGCTGGWPFGAPDQQASVAVANAALNAGALDLALHVTGSILARNPHDMEALATQGDALYAKGDTDAAARSYNAILAIDPNSVRGQIGIGRVQLRDDPSVAEASFLRALQRDPRNVIALNNLGIARDLQGHHAQAQEAYRQALGIMPSDAAASTNLGLSLALSGDAGQAVQILQPLASDPAAPMRLRHDLALAMILAGNSAGAKRMLSGDLSAPEAAAAVAGYRELGAPGQSSTMMAQDRSVAPASEPAASPVASTRTGSVKPEEASSAGTAPQTMASRSAASEPGPSAVPASRAIEPSRGQPRTKGVSGAGPSSPRVISPATEAPPPARMAALPNPSAGASPDHAPPIAAAGIAPLPTPAGSGVAVATRETTVHRPAVAASPTRPPEVARPATSGSQDVSPAAPGSGSAATAKAGVTVAEARATPSNTEAVPPASANAPPVTPFAKVAGTGAATSSGAATTTAAASAPPIENGPAAVPPIAAGNQGDALTALAAHAGAGTGTLLSELSASSIQNLSLPLRPIMPDHPLLPPSALSPMSDWFPGLASNSMMQLANDSFEPAGAGLAGIASVASLTRSWPWFGKGWTVATIQPVAPPASPGNAAAPSPVHVQPAPNVVAEHASGSPGRLPYVQVASLDSQQAAQAKWQQLQAQMPDLLGGRSPVIVQAEVDGRTFWRLRTDGFATFSAANEFCGRLQAAGSGCWAVLAGSVVN